MRTGRRAHFRKFHTDRPTNLSSKNWFRIESSYEPSKQDIEQSQIDLGYHPNGYGGPSNVERSIYRCRFITTWSCSASCD
jgi:hypothetical protein